MTRALVVTSVLILASALACRPHPVHPGRSPGLEKYPSARDLYGLAERYRVKHGLPALGIGIVHRGETVGLGMAGERAAGSADWATLDDVFDVASCSKSVTATIAAWLVERGVVQWTTTLGQAFPELGASLHPWYVNATLEQLLRHRAGLGHDMNRNARWAGWHREHAGRSAAEQRHLFAADVLQRSPRATPGTESYYTSDGYIVAGSLLERAAGIEWEQLVRTTLFQPLGLTSLTYGVPSDGGGETPVSGHEEGWFGRAVIVPPNRAEYGAPPFGSPAGFLYASLPDLLRYVDVHIQGHNGQGPLLRAESFKRLHARGEDPRFGLGWEVEVTRDADGRAVEHSVYHGGYSGRSRANMWFAPETGWGTVIVTNHGRGDDAMTADIFYALIREFGLVR
jgi:CubicO group peptidase (beta-lactamase class C family)